MRHLLTQQGRQECVQDATQSRKSPANSIARILLRRTGIDNKPAPPPAEGNPGIGSSGVSGIETVVSRGDPNQKSVYTSC